MRIAILGPRGTFSEEAAYKFNKSPEVFLCADIFEIFESVIEGRAEYGIVPVENSLEGSIGITLDLLLTQDVKVYGEIILDISHNLMALPGTKMSDVKEVISHPHALAQCKKFLRELKVETRSFPSTAEAAKEISEKRLRGTAALAPKVAAQLYGLEILREGVQDQDKNQTRFLVIYGKDHENTGRDKTSIIFGLKDRPGALYETLGTFAQRNINLTKIESRPSRKALGDYVFFIDFEGHREDQPVGEALEELGEKTLFLKVLGSYPRENA
jgi:prephenate dehydratase